MIYYIFTYNSTLPGVNAKIIAKIKALDSLSVSIRGIALYTDKNADLSQISNELIECFYFNPPKVNGRILKSRPFGLLNSYLTKRKEAKYLYNEILKNKKIDLLITRYGTSDFSTLWLVKKLNGKILYESNTNEIEQLKLKFKGLFKSPLWVSYDYYCEKYIGPKVLRKVKGLICVTNEIETYQKARINQKENPKLKVVSNGIKVEDFDVARDDLSNQLKFLMILGVDSPWNGLDKIANAIMNSEKNIKLFVVGNVSQEFSSPKIIYTGALNKKGISKLIHNEKVICGIGTLALERKGITEACPLKVREYLSRGLPVIYNYYDTDIDSDAEFRDKYCIKLKSESEEINLNYIVKRLKKIQSLNNYHEHIRDFAERKVDMRIKMIEYKEMITSLID